MSVTWFDEEKEAEDSKDLVPVYGIGLPRTGTNSLAHALNALGICGQNFCVLNRVKNSYHTHGASLRNRYKFLVRNGVFADLRSFVENRLAENSDALFILTDRRAKEWKASVRTSLGSKGEASAALLAQCSAEYKKQAKALFQETGKETQLLVVDIARESDEQLWKKLGKFLNVTVDVKSAFPCVNLNNPSVMDQFMARLRMGGDSRIVVNPATRRNKYLSAPHPEPSLVQRSSTTCNYPSEEAFEHSYRIYCSLVGARPNDASDDAAKTPLGSVEEQASPRQVIDATEFYQACASVRASLRKLCQLPEAADVVLTPSGTDAEYIPVVVAANLAPGRGIINVVTRQGEVGSSSLVAAGLRHFDDVTPFGINGGKKGMPLDGAKGWQVKTVEIPARHRDGRLVDDVEQRVRNALRGTGFDPSANFWTQPHTVILHSVAGSKTGSLDEPILAGWALNVVDFCQMRGDLSQVGEWVRKGAIVLVSASKFYGAPPFCGAVMLPGIAVRALNHPDVALPKNLDETLTAFEFPSSLTHVQEKLSSEFNVGLLSRWNVGIFEMERYNLDPDIRKGADEAMARWNAHVRRLIQESRNLELIDELQSQRVAQHPSVLPFAVRDAEKQFFSVSQLKALHKQLLFDQNLFCGQPVKLCEERAALRLALSCVNVKALVTDFDQEIQRDERLVSAIDKLVETFNV